MTILFTLQSKHLRYHIRCRLQLREIEVRALLASAFRGNVALAADNPGILMANIVGEAWKRTGASREARLEIVPQPGSGDDTVLTLTLAGRVFCIEACGDITIAPMPLAGWLRLGARRRRAPKKVLVTTSFNTSGYLKQRRVVESFIKNARHYTARARRHELPYLEDNQMPRALLSRMLSPAQRLLVGRILAQLLSEGCIGRVLGEYGNAEYYWWVNDPVAPGSKAR